jgi:hypothetical protein
MASQKITRQYPGKTADELYGRVHEVMERMATKVGMKYETDAEEKSGSVAMMGAKGVYEVKDGEVTVALDFPMIFPLKKQVTSTVEEKLDRLFA